MKNLYLSLFCISISIIGYSQYYPEGPDAPEVNLQSFNNKFQIQLSNSTMSNNYGENFNYYANVDSTAPDQFWRFQGYIVYQVTNSAVSTYETTDTNVIRIAAIVDKLDTTASLLFTSYNTSTGCAIHTLNAPNLGIPSTIEITHDVFTGQAFTEGQSYCFRVYAYASNHYNIDSLCNIPDQIVLSTRSSQLTQINTFCAISTLTAGLLENQKTTVSFYPNPVTNVLTINNSLLELLEVIITDTEGRQIAEFIVSETKTFDFSSFAPGCYFLHSKSGIKSQTDKFGLYMNNCG